MLPPSLWHLPLTRGEECRDHPRRQGAVNILYRKDIAENPERSPELISEYEEQLLNPYIAADRGFIDAVIEPHATRGQITKALRALANKRVDLPTRKHGNIPL